MINQIVIALAVLLVIALPAAVLLRWVIRQRKDHKMWLRLTDGQEATEL